MRQARVALSLILMAACSACQPAAIAPAPAAYSQAAREVSHGWDWGTQRVDSPRLARVRRSMPYAAQAFAAPADAWSTGGTAGLPLAGLGLAAGDFVPNSPAATFRAAGDVLANQLIFLTQSGKVLRVDRLTGKSGGVADTARPSSRTAVTLSANGGRAYVLGDDGTLSAVNLTTMKTVGTQAVGPAYGIAAWLDPDESTRDDTADVLYVANNAGEVVRLLVAGRMDGGISSITETARYPVATDAVPVAGRSLKIAASAVSLGGLIVVGDQAGFLHVYNAHDATVRGRYAVGGAVDSAPSLELQDGSYTPHDANGNALTVPMDTPTYAFVTAGAACAWVDLFGGGVVRSPALRVDDQTPGTAFGPLARYAFAPPQADEILAAGAVQPIADGGSTLDYMRFQSDAAYPPGSVLAGASLAVRAAADGSAPAPAVYATSALTRSGNATWQGDALTASNHPLVAPGLAGYGLAAVGPVAFKQDGTYTWDVASAFPNPAPDGRYALALGFANANAPLWPASVGDPQPATVGDPRPRLTLAVAPYRLPSASIATSPLIDSLFHVIYVFAGNTLYQLDYKSPVAFADVDTDPATGSPVPHALFERAGGPTGRAPATYAGARYIGNFTSPTISLDGSSLYALGRVPSTATPPLWTDVLSKFAVPLKAGASGLQPQVFAVGAIAGAEAPVGPGAREASTALAIVADGSTQGGDIYFGLADGRIYQVQH